MDSANATDLADSANSVDSTGSVDSADLADLVDSYFSLRLDRGLLLLLLLVAFSSLTERQP